MIYDEKLNVHEWNNTFVLLLYVARYTELDKLVRDKESVLERARNGYMEKEQALQAVIQELQSQLEDAQIRERQLTWSNQDLAKEKQVQIDKYVTSMWFLN